MTRARNGCARCGGTKRGRRRNYRADALVDCAFCLEPVCSRHAVWDPLWKWICTRCDRSERAEAER